MIQKVACGMCIRRRSECHEWKIYIYTFTLWLGGQLSKSAPSRLLCHRIPHAGVLLICSEQGCAIAMQRYNMQVSLRRNWTNHSLPVSKGFSLSAVDFGGCRLNKTPP